MNEELLVRMQSQSSCFSLTLQFDVKRSVNANDSARAQTKASCTPQFAIIKEDITDISHKLVIKKNITV